jgi:hypothetical protein
MNDPFFDDIRLGLSNDMQQVARHGIPIVIILFRSLTRSEQESLPFIAKRL